MNRKINTSYWVRAIAVTAAKFGLLMACLTAGTILLFAAGCAFDTEEEQYVPPPSVQSDAGCAPCTQDDASCPKPEPVTDSPGNGIVVVFYEDKDGDGYGSDVVIYAPLGTTSLPGASSVSGDCDDTDATIHPGATEVCNGKDDNCDGVIDEGTECALCPGGPIMPYYRDVDGDGYGNVRVMSMMCSGLGAPGWVDIAGDCDDSDASVNPGATEVCNGKDDNCDGAIDEGCECVDGATRACYSGPADTAGVGICLAGTQGCTNGQWGACLGQVLPQAEVCEGAIDQDCDGVVDNGCECVNGATRECYSGATGTKNVGLCHGGTQTCESGEWGACNGEVLPQTEVCGDGLDQNCDGEADDGCMVEVRLSWTTPNAVVSERISLYGCWGTEDQNGQIACEGPGSLPSWGVLVNEVTKAQCISVGIASVTCTIWVLPGKVLRFNAQYGQSSYQYGCNVPQFGGCTNLPEVKVVANGTMLSSVVKYGPGTYDANWQYLVP